MPVLAEPQPIGPRSGRRPGWLPYGLLGAALVVVAALVIALQPGHEPDATAMVLTAASRTAGVSSLRASVTVQYSDGAVSETAGAMVGPNVQLETREVSAGGDERTESIVVVGDTMWETQNGETTERVVTENGRLAPFTRACESVLSAALKSAAVQETGTEDVNGVEATGYRVILDDTSRAALSQLGPSELAWFELEYPRAVSRIDVWIADNLIRRVSVASEGRTSTTDFFDFGATIEITPPAAR